jgi:hypothetical protein
MNKAIAALASLELLGRCGVFTIGWRFEGNARMIVDALCKT